MLDDRGANKLVIIIYTQILIRIVAGCVAQLAERRSLAGELTLSCARPSEDG